MLFLLDAHALQGRELYHGPVSELDAYLASLGFVRPSYMDVADFASEVSR